MTRPTAWEPLAASDPVPGDPEGVVAVARDHGEVAALLEEQARTLRELAGADGWDSDAGRVFATSAQDLAGRLDTARRRYSTVASALSDYAPELRHAQAEADAARLAARAAQQVVLEHDVPFPQLAPMPTDPAAIAAERQRREIVDGARADVARARRRLDEAVRSRDDAARRAAHRIRDVLDHDGLTDSFWDKAKDWASSTWDSVWTWWKDHCEAIATVTSWISTAASFAAIVVSFVPIVGQAVATVLFAVALAATVVTLLCHLTLYAEGEGSLLDIGIDIVGLVTLGYGRAASGALRGATEGFEAAARTSAVAVGEAEGRAAVSAAARTLGSRTAAAAEKSVASATLRSSGAVVEGFGSAAERQLVDGAKLALEGGASRVGPAGVLPKLRWLGPQLPYLDGEAARSVTFARSTVAAIKAESAAAPGIDALVAAQDQVVGAAARVTGNAWAGTAVDVADKTGLLDGAKEAVDRVDPLGRWLRSRAG